MRHYAPATLRFIEKRIVESQEGVLSGNDKGEMLLKLVTVYSKLGRDDNMLFVYPELFEKLFDAILAQPGIFMNENMVHKLCEGIGYLRFHCRSVE